MSEKISTLESPRSASINAGPDVLIFASLMPLLPYLDGQRTSGPSLMQDVTLNDESCISSRTAANNGDPPMPHIVEAYIHVFRCLPEILLDGIML